jgi:hypothetical protein
MISIAKTTPQKESPEPAAGSSGGSGDTNAKVEGPISVAVYISDSSYSLAFTAGLAFPFLRDQRYRVEVPTTSAGSGMGSTGQPNSNLVRIMPNEPISSSVAVFANYCFTRRSLSFICPVSVGLATNLSSSLQVMSGPSFRITSIPLVNSAYFSGGVIYGQRKVLNDDLVGVANPTVTANTSAGSVLTSKYSVSGFVALSFGFLGGSADKFKGVYDGLSKSTTTTGATDK